jgi:hypothetical protein
MTLRIRFGKRRNSVGSANICGSFANPGFSLTQSLRYNRGLYVLDAHTSNIGDCCKRFGIIASDIQLQFETGEGTVLASIWQKIPLSEVLAGAKIKTHCLWVFSLIFAVFFNATSRKTIG